MISEQSGVFKAKLPIAADHASLQQAERPKEGLTPAPVGLNRQDASKRFFFEKKNQKTFVPLSARCRTIATAGPKVFCFFSSEKKALLVLPHIEKQTSRAAQPPANNALTADGVRCET